MERAAVMSDGAAIGPADLPFGEEPPSASESFLVRVPEDWLDLKAASKEVLKATEEILIKRALALKNGNQSRAAEALGLSRRALVTKIQAYGLGPKRAS
jgi:two-component system response regulator AtoC